MPRVWETKLKGLQAGVNNAGNKVEGLLNDGQMIDAPLDDMELYELVIIVAVCVTTFAILDRRVRRGRVKKAA